MKKVIIEDEVYPVYFMVDKFLHYNTIEIPDEKVEWIERVTKEYIKVQDYLSRIAHETI